MKKKTRTLLIVAILFFALGFSAFAQNEKAEALIIVKSGSNLNEILSHTKHKRNAKDQAYAIKKYTEPLTKNTPGTKTNEKYAINNFIVYGTKSTAKLSAKARYELVKQFKAKYKRIPKTQADWQKILEMNQPAASKPVNQVLSCDRLLGTDVTTASNNDYADAFGKAKSLGIKFVTLSLAWDDIEKSPGVYNNEFLAIANTFYPKQGTKLALIISPIDTNNLRLPSDLQNKEFNDPIVISRFNKLTEYVLRQTPDIDYVSVAIGNEIDVRLGTDKSKWDAYEDFFKQTSAYLKSIKKVKVGTKITFNGLEAAEAKSINKYSDAVMTTYYPLKSDFTVKDVSVVIPDFQKVVALYPVKEIQFLEVGYPSGALSDSSETKQAAFFTEVFKAWSATKNNVKVVNINWLHDRSPKEIDYYKQYYGISDKKFLEYLGTLGLRRYDGQQKQSFIILQKENAKGCPLP